MKTPNDASNTCPSNIETAAQMETIQYLPGSPHISIVGTVRDRVHRMEAVMARAHHGSGFLLSGIICINILILGSALVISSTLNHVAVTTVDRRIFLILLFILTMMWMLFYMRYTFRKAQGVLFKDNHAGPVWLKAGLVLFGLLSLLMDTFKLTYYVGYLHCDSAVNVAFPVVQAIFLLVQTYFLWTHAKDCVQYHTNVTRCGLTLMLSTNLVVWMAAVTEESLHQIPTVNISVSSELYQASYGEQKCKCSHSACDICKAAFYYLYPFNVEYSLFAAAMAYVMWRNVGRLVENRSHHKVKLHVKDVCFGPVVGLLLLVAGLVTFIFYEVYIQDEEQRNLGLLIHFIMNIVIVSLMSLSTVIGCVVYRLDHREHVSEKNPTRSLDVGLLVGASMGQFVISYFSIVAMVATEVRDHLRGLNLAWAVLLVVQLSLQNYFIVEGLHREPFHMIHMNALHTNAHTYQDHLDTSIIMKISKSRHVQTSGSNKPNWRRRVLKEVCVFLLLTNIILWIMPAFGARPQFDYSVELYFYSYTTWTAIVNIGLPFGIFYRMHCVASLLEVYLSS